MSPDLGVYLGGLCGAFVGLIVHVCVLMLLCDSVLGAAVTQKAQWLV